MQIWDAVVFFTWVVVATGLVVSCRRAGFVTTETWVFIGAMSIFWIEAPWNWVLLVRYDPDRFLMMPRDWPLLGLADGLPWNAPFVYGLWFVLPALAAKAFLAPRGLKTWQMVASVAVFGAVFEAVAEILLFIEPHRYAYTHVIHGFAYAEGQPNQYPLDVPIWVGLYVAACCLVVLRGYRTTSGPAKRTSDDFIDIRGGKSGSAQVDTLNRRKSLNRPKSLTARVSQLRALGGADDRVLPNIAAAIVIFNLVYLGTLLPALVTRLAGWRDVVGDPIPFGHVPWPGLPL